MKTYARSLLFALMWLAAGLAILAAAAYMGGKPDMRLFCLTWCWCFPPCCGFYAGWKEAGAGFGTGMRALVLPMLILAAAWWWLIPQLWNSLLAAKAGLYALAAGSFGGGMGAGFRKARERMMNDKKEQ